jgi:hypothetical protein
MSLRAERWPRAVRWIAPAALFALTPKCLLCVLAYAGLGGLVGASGRELCGAELGSSTAWVFPLAWLGLGGFSAVGFVSARHKTRASDPKRCLVAVEVDADPAESSAEKQRPETLKPSIYDWP